MGLERNLLSALKGSLVIENEEGCVSNPCYSTLVRLELFRGGLYYNREELIVEVEVDAFALVNTRAADLMEHFHASIVFHSEKPG